MQKAPETLEQQMKDSDTVFTAISTGDFDDFKMAEKAVVMIYVTDMSISRVGISHAMKRLKQHYAKGSNVELSGGERRKGKL